MDISSFYLGNRFIISTIYTLAIFLCCLWIFFRTRKLYRLSGYEGLRYFSSAFLFYGRGFLTIYFFDW